MHNPHRIRERPQQLLSLFHEAQRRPPRGTRPEPGHPRKQLDQAFNLWTGDGGHKGESLAEQKQYDAAIGVAGKI
jgi:hypothetical protein